MILFGLIPDEDKDNPKSLKEFKLCYNLQAADSGIDKYVRGSY